jgi:Ca2+-binding EF-hand superfamily protein
MMGAAAILVLVVAAAPQQEPAAAATATEAVSARNLIFLAESRPVFVRLKVTAGGRPFEASWIDSIGAIYKTLDRNGDGSLTTKEADPKAFAALVRLATGGALNPAELDAHPKDGKVSIEELAEALRGMMGPFQLTETRSVFGRTDALFDQLDRDKDGELSRTELGAIAGSLRPLDFDDDEMISAAEIEPARGVGDIAALDAALTRRGGLAAFPSVVELFAGESSFRPARMLLKKYDKGKGDVPGRPDNKLSSEEFAIDPEVFARSDTNQDDALDLDELRKLIAGSPADITLLIDLTEGASGEMPVRIEAAGALPKDVQVRRLADGDVELKIGAVRVDVHVENGSALAGQVRRGIEQQFKAADVNKDGYLEGKELAPINAQQSPLSGLVEVIDRDGDGKVYLKEMLEFADRQTEAARWRLIVTTDDKGRAIFGILDLDRDRRLGAREVMRTVDRAMTWDSNGDGRVSADEIPYHFQVNIASGGVPGLTGENTVFRAIQSMRAPGESPTALGPDWFQKMDRNKDGDVSRREFLGPRDTFDRLDRDNDGLIDADEARAAVAPEKIKAGAAGK